MSDYRKQYWRDSIGKALCEMDKFSLFTSEQLDELGDALATSAEFESQAFGWDVASANRSTELRREEDNLKKELARERNKVTCRECNGVGRLRYNAGPWAVDTGCMKCNGDGRHDP